MESVRSSPAGRWVAIPGGAQAFVPNPLPPPLKYDVQLVALLSEADRAIGGVASIADFLPNPGLFVVPFLKIEAVLSSRIEGTQTTTDAVFQAEISDRASLNAETREVVNYLEAMYLGMARLGEQALTLGLVCELHARLLDRARGESSLSGHPRETQVHIGARGRSIHEASYVPPPPDLLPALLEEWERFANADSQLPPLIHCAIMHAHFELIHPFLDGNGRIGRLLMSLFLIARHELSQPLLFLSAFFESHRTQYYERLQAISRDGDWNGWVAFFLRAVAAQSKQALSAARRILGLRDELREELQSAQASSHTLRLLDFLFENPYTTMKHAAERLGVSYPTASKAIRKLEAMGFLQETTGRQRDQRFRATRLLEAIEAAAVPGDAGASSVGREEPPAAAP